MGRPNREIPRKSWSTYQSCPLQLFIQFVNPASTAYTTNQAGFDTSRPYPFALPDCGSLCLVSRMTVTGGTLLISAVEWSRLWVIHVGFAESLICPGIGPLRTWQFALDVCPQVIQVHAKSLRPFPHTEHWKLNRFRYFEGGSVCDTPEEAPGWGGCGVHAGAPGAPHNTFLHEYFSMPCRLASKNC